MNVISVNIDRVDDYDLNGYEQLDVRANDIRVGRLVVEPRGPDCSSVVDWKWDGNFSPDIDWPVKSDEVDDLLEAISNAIKKQLVADCPGCDFDGLAKIAAL